jgi:hypothetical protein
MDVSPATVGLAIHEVVLDGVEPGDPLVARAIERAIGASLPAGLSAQVVAAAVTETIREQASR